MRDQNGPPWPDFPRKLRSSVNAALLQHLQVGLSVVKPNERCWASPDKARISPTCGKQVAVNWQPSSAFLRLARAEHRGFGRAGDNPPSVSLHGIVRIIHDASPLAARGRPPAVQIGSSTNLAMLCSRPTHRHLGRRQTRRLHADLTDRWLNSDRGSADNRAGF